MEDEKLNALAEFLGVAPEEITYDGYEYSTDQGDYKVLTNEEADEDFENYQRGLWDDLGLESFSEWFQNWILENAVDKNYFQDDMHSSNSSYAHDIAEESDYQYGNRLVQECYDADLISDDDFETGTDGEPDYKNCIYDTDELADKLADHMDENYDNTVEWVIDSFGKEFLSRIVKEHPDCIDTNKVIEKIKSNDGRGCLAAYDGKENEVDYNGTTYYIYHTN